MWLICYLRPNTFILGHFCGKINEVEGPTEQQKYNNVEDEPQQVKTDPLPQCPLGLTQGEGLLVKEQLNRYKRQQFECDTWHACIVQLV